MSADAGEVNSPYDEDENQNACVGCKQPLTETEFEYYENHWRWASLERQPLNRLCKQCVMEERAR